MVVPETQRNIQVLKHNTAEYGEMLCLLYAVLLAPPVPSCASPHVHALSVPRVLSGLSFVGRTLSLPGLFCVTVCPASH